MDLVYNLDRIPELEFVDNVFYKVPSLLFGTAKGSRFARNKVHTRLEALRLGDLAFDWYESSRKRGLIVEDNDFSHCAEWYSSVPIICAFENGKLDAPKKDIHQDLIFRRNRFTGVNRKLFSLERCTNVEISENTYDNTHECEIDEAVIPLRFIDCEKIVLWENQFRF